MDATDLDAVLENISLLIEDMEENINDTKKKKSINGFLTNKMTGTEKEATKDDPKNNREPIKEHVSTPPTTTIRHEFTHKSTSEIDEFDSTLNALNSVIDNASHFEELQRAREASENNKQSAITTKRLPNNCRLSDRKGQRLCCSAESSPILSRSMIASLSSRQQSGSPHRELRTNSITPRLVLQNIDKFDVAVKCPDGNLFKAGVFKAWTSFQLAWKIAHVRGMTEKIALVIEEHISDLHLKRLIEDHEIIHTVTTNWAPDSNNILVMSERITKYDLFNEPADYLPIEMFDTTTSNLGDSSKNIRRSSLLRSIMAADKTPDLQGWVFVKAFNKQNWKKKFLRIKNKTLYTSDTDDEMAPLKQVYRCEESYLYDCLPQFTEDHKAPLQNCFCIIPKVVTSWKEIKCFCVSSERYLIGWISGFRFGKYGQQLYTNFREAMNKEANLRRTNSARVSLLFRRSYGENGGSKENKATIDFSGENGRVVSDPNEVLKIQSEIALEIPKPAKRRSGTSASIRQQSTLCDKAAWYHGKIDREQAIKVLKKQGAKEGLFLVRESSSSHASIVLTVVARKGKISHYQILQNKNLYGIEHGPQFNSLEHLIEAYCNGSVEGNDFSLKKPCPLS